MSSLVLLPGLMCDQAVWPAQSAGLADLAASQVIDYGDCDSLPRMAEIALAQAPARFALAAHSMGGRVALEVIRQAPERVTALALLDTGYQARPAGPLGETEKTQRLALLKLAEHRGMRAMGEQWVQGMVHPDRLSDRALIEDILRMIARKTPAQFAGQIQALLERPDGEPVLKTIRCPTLVLCGREDSWSPLARHQQMAKLIPGSRLIAIETCGHMSTMERPEAVTEALRGWLTDAAQQAA
jgi:pimeloyl-ACP methyl ester carboxylesterase